MIPDLTFAMPARGRAEAPGATLRSPTAGLGVGSLLRATGSCGSEKERCQARSSSKERSEVIGD